MTMHYFDTPQQTQQNKRVVAMASSSLRNSFRIASLLLVAALLLGLSRTGYTQANDVEVVEEAGGWKL